MKKLILIIGIAILSFNLFAQFKMPTPDNIKCWNPQKGTMAALVFAHAGFGANEIVMRTDYFDKMTVQQKDQLTLQIYGTTAIVSVAIAWVTPVISKAIKIKKHKNRRKWKY